MKSTSKVSLLTLSLTPGLIALLLALPGSIHAQNLAYAVVDGTYPSSAELHLLDLRTGDLNSIGATAHPITHLALDSTGTLYGVDPNADQLMVIDTGTGAAVPVGPLDTDVEWVSGLAIDDDDTLWMTALTGRSAAALYSIDLASATATWRFELPSEYTGALAHDGTQLITASWTLSIIDVATGDLIPVSGQPLGIWGGRALDVDDEGMVIGLMLCGPCMLPWDVLTLAAIDQTTGELVATGPNQPHGTWGLAAIPGSLFFDGFETGDATGWLPTSEITIPSAPDLIAVR